MNFDSTGAIFNAYVDQYLLEKIRIVSQAKEERNYHVFYCVLAGLGNEERNKLKLTKAADYAYLNKVRNDDRFFAPILSHLSAACRVCPNVIRETMPKNGKLFGTHAKF